jgi:hypothetical protein
MIKQNNTTEIEGTVSACHSQRSEEILPTSSPYCSYLLNCHFMEGQSHVKGVERDLQCCTCALDVPKLGFPATSKVEFSGTVTVTRLLFTAMSF